MKKQPGTYSHQFRETI